MLGLILVIAAGVYIKRLWPYGVMFLLIVPAIAVVWKTVGVNRTHSAFGEPLVNQTVPEWGISYLSTAALCALVFFIARLVPSLWKKDDED
jgi:hypothetical protein